ncbi:MAG: UDP-N-acetylmuramoyl-tripeptide--D-alanyl-D-alanine ligase [Pseudomonadota bacterium]
MNATLSDIAGMLGVQNAMADVSIAGVSTDTRSIRKGELFVALNGPNYRGERFVAQAAKAGAAAAVVENIQSDALPQLQVADTHIALITMAKSWRQRFEPLVIGITGSNGKTTMRSLISACCGDHVLATAGNLNNNIGVPLMLLRLDDSVQRAVFEMGANHAGEIAELTDMVCPSIGIITNAGPAHLEGFGSIEGVAHAKGELFQALGAGDTAVINADDQYSGLWHEFAKPANIVTFGSADHADVWYSDCHDTQDGLRFTLHTPAGSAHVALQLHGEHNAMNSCGAAAVALTAKRPLDTIVTALSSVAAEPGRQAPKAGVSGSTIIDDSYNANPASMVAAARSASATAETVVMVIGDMGECGADEVSIHRELGKSLRVAGVTKLFTLGPLTRHTAEAFGPGASAFDDLRLLVAAVRDVLAAGTTVVVKGSRAMRMERVVDGLLNNEVSD